MLHWKGPACSGVRAIKLRRDCEQPMDAAIGERSFTLEAHGEVDRAGRRRPPRRGRLAAALFAALRARPAVSLQLPRRPAPRPTAPRFELGHVTAEGLASAFLGGTVGAVGSVVAIEAKRVKVKKSKQCPYCDGTGAIACAACLGTGLTDGEPCRLCGGRTVHTCENCKGRGRFIPTMLDARVSRDPETELEEIGLQ